MDTSYRIKFIDYVSAFNGNVYKKDEEYNVDFITAMTFVNDGIAHYVDKKPMTIDEFCAAPPKPNLDKLQAEADAKQPEATQTEAKPEETPKKKHKEPKAKA